MRQQKTTDEFSDVPVSVPAAAVTVCPLALVSEIDVPFSEMLVLARDIVAFEPSPGVCETVIPVLAVTSET